MEKVNAVIKRRALPLKERVCLMGILNVTPDSFSDGGKYLDPSRAVERAKRMVEEGADIIDVGGESSRPGSRRVSAEEELGRILPVIKALSAEIEVPVSVDTYKSEVAREALSCGASIINDITALRGDPGMAGVIAGFGAGVALMHMKGTPGNMQDDTRYDDLLGEIYLYLEGSVRLAEAAGIASDRIMIDPGIGFGKTAGQNFELLRGLSYFKKLGKPLLVGTSRKSFLGEVTGKGAGERIFGTAATVAAAIMNGADIVRVHDVGEMRDVARVTRKIMGV
ncbi:MAG: dihydropteroate synthase [Candidatus Omnitrophota bacterium]